MPDEVPKLKPEDAAWLAGYIDGDGCICLSRKSGRGHRSPIVIIDSADIELLEHVRSLVGGNIVRKKKYADHHRQAWSWRLLGTAKIVALLEQLLPYFRCSFKEQRARMLVHEWRVCTPRNGAYTVELAAAKMHFEDRFLSIGEGRGKRSKPLAA